MPTLSNTTGMQTALVPSIDHEGRNIMVALVKGTWVLSPRAQPEPLHDAVPVQIGDVPLFAPSPALAGEGWGEGNSAHRTPPSSSPRPGPHPRPLPLMRERESMLRLASDLCEAKPQVDVIVVAPEKIDERRIGIAIDNFRFVKTTGPQWTLGPLSRIDKARLQYAGTYDDAWRRKRMPLLPLDFDLRYHQAAPADQVMPRASLSGDEPFSVSGLHGALDKRPQRLPGKAVLVTGHIGKDYFSRLAALDTVQLWADEPWLTLTWRLALKPRQKIEEIGTVVLHATRTQTARELYGLA